MYKKGERMSKRRVVRSMRLIYSLFLSSLDLVFACLNVRLLGEGRSVLLFL